MILEASMGVGGGIAGIISGIWLDARGFFEPVACSAAIHFLSFLLIFLLPDSLMIRDEQNKTPSDGFGNEAKNSFDDSASGEDGSYKYGSCKKQKLGRMSN